jgi:hypothetical protein
MLYVLKTLMYEKLRNEKSPIASQLHTWATNWGPIFGAIIVTRKYPATQWQLCLDGSLKQLVNMPETVKRKGLQVTKSLKASPALKKLEVGGLKGPC